jgi:hypothetical protein
MTRFRANLAFSIRSIAYRMWTMALKNDEFKVVYFVIPKAACTSIRAVLVGKENTDKSENCSHDEFQQDQFQHYTWFTFVRHPLDRLVSLYYSLTRTNNWTKGFLRRRLRVDEMPEMRAFWKILIHGFDGLRDMHLTPQVTQLPERQLDFIGRFERLESDWAQLDLPPLPHLNPTKHGTWFRYYYDDDGNILPEARQLEELYSEDYRAFGYSGLPDQLDKAAAMGEWYGRLTAL